MWTIVVGAGSGHRFGKPKQYAPLHGRRVIDHARDIAASASDGVVVVVPPQDAEEEQAVAGGATRGESVRAGLDAVPMEATIVCVHDAARPLASVELFQRVVAAVSAGADGAIPGIPVTDTIKVVKNGVVTETPDRSTLVAVQTPQAFRADVLRAAHRRAHTAGLDTTDDAGVVEAAGGRIVVVDGDPRNRKITSPADLEWAQQQDAGPDERP